MDETSNEHSNLDQDKQFEDTFIKNNLNFKSTDLSVLDAAEATDHLLKSNLYRLVESLNLKDFATIEKPNRIQLNSEAWAIYEKLRQNYSLEGDQNHWLTCLVYVTYHRITLMNRIYHLTQKSKQDDIETQPTLSVVNLLRFTNLSLTTFLKKCKKLNEILNIPSELCYRIDQLELNYNVSCVLFSKYKLIFSHMFNCYSTLYDFKSNDYIKSSELFEFTWLLFINIRGKFIQLSHDLVNSFHLLICCMNLIYLNLLPFQHDDPDLKNYKNFLLLIQSDLKNKSNSNFFIDYLCKQFDGQTLEAKTINAHYFKPHLQSLIDKNMFGTRLIAPKCEHSSLIDLKKRAKFKRILTRLGKSYDSFLIANNLNLKCNAFNCLDLIYSFDIDERLFLTNYKQKQVNECSASANVTHSDNDDDLDEIDDETDSHSLINFETESKLIDKLVLPRSLHVLTTLNKEDLKEDLNDNFNLINFDLVETHLSNQLKAYLINQFNFKAASADINDIQHHQPCRKKPKLDNHELKNMQIENSVKLIDEVFDLVCLFYLKVLDLMLSTEKNRLGIEQFKNNKLIENELFHKSIYIVCFELVYNFAQIESFQLNENNQEINLSSSMGDTPLLINLNSYFNIITIKNASTDQFKFPKSLEIANLKEYDFFRVIEPFIKGTNITSSSSSTTHSNEPPQLALLDRQMIRYLSRLEEEILESLVWSSSSPIWSKLKELKLNENYLNSFQSSSNNINMHLLVPFPLYEDVSNMSSLIQTPNAQQSTILNAAVSNSSSGTANSDIIINLTPNPMTSSSSANIFTSPAKHPTITRVVCSTSGETSSRNSLTNKPIQILSLNQNKKQLRLNNLTNSLMFFFRKFYNLANSRVRDLVEKLDMVNLSLEFHNSTNNKTTNNETQATNPSNPSFQNQQLANEFQQAILKKIWNIFEYSICIGTTNKQNLITDRHLDHLILCSIYATCRLYSFKIQFNDIIRIYRYLWPNKTNVYKQILIEQDKFSDLIAFYNELFIKVSKPYLIELNNSASTLTPNFLLTENTALSKKLISPSTAFLSPVVPKLQQTALTNLVNFSPRRLSDNVFVSPIKQNLVSVQQHRNKLLFSLKDTNPNKSLRLINDMIRKNEVKIKPSNKRIFSDISTASVNSSQSNSSSVTATTNTPQNNNTIKSIKLEDETDSGVTKHAMMRITNLSTAKGFLSTVVGSKLGFMSNTNNLVTMVVGAQSASNNAGNSFANTTTSVSSSLVGASFARKLQNIQTERIN